MKDNGIRTVILLAPSETFACPPDWILYQASCYFVGDSNQNFVDANTTCVEKSAALVTVNDGDEEAFLRNLSYVTVFYFIYSLTHTG